MKIRTFTNSLAVFAIMGIVGAANAALWTPADMTTEMWYDAADASTIAHVGGAVSAWNDKSGNGNHAGAPTGTASAAPGPTYNATGHNGLPSLYFNDSALGIPALTAGSDYSFFTVLDAAPKTAFSGSTSYLRWQNGAQYLALDYHTGYVLSAGNPIPGPATGTGGGGGGTQILDVVLDFGTTNGVVTYANGTQIATATFSSNSAAAYGGGTGNIGKYSSEYTEGYIQEIIIASSAVDDATRKTIEGYLAWKWGLVESLPGNHPYKTDGSLFVTIPEPSTAILAGLGLMGVCFRRRRSA